MTVIWADVKSSVIFTWLYINFLLLVALVTVALSAYIMENGVPASFTKAEWVKLQLFSIERAKEAMASVAAGMADPLEVAM